MISQAKTRLARLLPKSQFARSVGVLVGGTGSAQLLLILAAPLLTRLYTPDDFGLLAVYAGLLSITGVIASLRYELAIPLPEDDTEAANVAMLSFLLVGLTTLLTALLVSFFATPITDALGVPALASYLWLLPLGILIAGGYSVVNYWAVRSKRFKTIAGTKFRQALATLAIQVSAFKMGGLGLLLGHAAGQGVGTISLARPALTKSAFKQVSWGRIKNAAGRYRRFPYFNTGSSLLNSAGTQIGPLGFAALFGATVAGQYALAHRIVTLPMNLLGNAISQVFLPMGVDANRSEKLASFTEDTFRSLAGLAMPASLFLFFFGPDVFAFVFGERWRWAGYVASWMAPWLFFQFCMSPLTVFLILERLRMPLLLQAFLFTIRTIALGLSMLIDSVESAIVLFSMSSALGYAVFLFVKLDVTGVLFISAIKIILTQWVKGGAIFTPLLIVHLFGLSSFFCLALILTIILAGIHYLFLFRSLGEPEC